jgi:hypothetical protein
MSSLLLLNGSPRGASANSKILLDRLGEGWFEAGGEEPDVLTLAKPQEAARAAEVFAGYDAVVLACPLYTDAMPGHVKAFIETLASHKRGEDLPCLGFVVQSGFSEAVHSRHLERYFEKLARRLGAPYAGTALRGGGEGIRMMPDRANARLFERMRAFGGDLLRVGHFDAERLREHAGRERYSPARAAFMGVAGRLPVFSWYWNSQLKRNGAWERRFDAPYAEAYGG